MIYIFKAKAKPKSNIAFIRYNWQQLKARAQTCWSCLNDNDFAQIDGLVEITEQREGLIQKLQEKCGFNREQARVEIQRLEMESLLGRKPIPSYGRLEMETLLDGKSTPPCELNLSAE